MKRMTFASMIMALSFSLPGVGHSEETPAGQELFQKHGCTNCHGADGVHPTSRYVPILRGKPAGYIFENASAIFSGQHKSEKTHFMHDQFCIGDAKEEGCYPAPNQADLRLIADWLGGDKALSEKHKTEQGLYVTSVDAYKRLQDLGDQALLIDVRTRAEVAFLGMPTMAAANIPYMTLDYETWDEAKQNFKMVPNSEFTVRMEGLLSKRGLTKDTPIFLICRSGSRSAKAANLLGLAGFKQVYTVTDGFEGGQIKEGPRKGERVVNGWKNAGLPWTYQLDKDVMYFDL
jgi:rhodanese-related sulfurtransferase